MITPKIALAVILAGLTASLTFGESSDSGSATVNERTLAYKVTGDSVSGSVTTDKGKHRFEATIDGVTYEAVADTKELRWNDQRFELDGFRKIEVIINRTEVEVIVDGERKLPK